MLSPADLQREVEATGFRGEALEKVLRLLELLEGFRSHPFLKTRVALKGGTTIRVRRIATSCLLSDPESSRRSRRCADA